MATTAVAAVEGLMAASAGLALVGKALVGALAQQQQTPTAAAAAAALMALAVMAVRQQAATAEAASPTA